MRRWGIISNPVDCCSSIPYFVGNAPDRARKALEASRSGVAVEGVS